MNKALHVLVYLFLILSATSLWFEIELNKKRELLRDRQRIQEEYLIKIASTVEKAEPNKDATAEIKKDISPVEAKLVGKNTVELTVPEGMSAPTRVRYAWSPDPDVNLVNSADLPATPFEIEL